ncbi:M1 family aminopeptidase [Escherichia coli]
MENKGLNIFNSKYVLARTDTATDKDYLDIERVIGHEYFHNWTGNAIDLSRLVPAQPERRFNRLPRSGVQL